MPNITPVSRAVKRSIQGASGKGMTRGKSRQSRKNAARYFNQYARTIKNKVRKLTRLVRINPNDSQMAADLKRIKALA